MIRPTSTVLRPTTLARLPASPPPRVTRATHAPSEHPPRPPAGRWRLVLGLAAGLGLMAAAPAQALDLAALWDFSQPALSEQRFTEALAGASADERLILRTQIARTHGLRRDFAQARSLLAAIEPELPTASAEARVRHALESGRSLVSATHDRASITEADRAEARRRYLQARDEAQAGGLDALAIDALHMMAFVDTAPAQQLAWNREALALALRSAQPDARRWEGSLRYNTGLALKESGDPEAAIEQFAEARAAYLRAGRTRGARYADWAIGWTERSRGRLAQALEIQRRLEGEWAADGSVDTEVLSELAALYTALGDPARAADYATRAKAGR